MFIVVVGTGWTDLISLKNFSYYFVRGTGFTDNITLQLGATWGPTINSPAVGDV